MGQGVNEIIGDKRAAILDMAGKFGADNIRIFGSVVRGEADESSDVDFLVHFKVSDFFKRMDFKDGLEKMLGRKVDVVSDKALSEFIAPYILAEARPL